MAAAGRGRRGSVRELYKLELRPRQVAVLSIGLSAILLRTANHVLAFDLGLFTIRRREIAALQRLDAQFCTHIHFDHWSTRFARAIREQTGAPAIVEPQIAERARVPNGCLTRAAPGLVIAIGDMTITPVVGRHTGPITLFQKRGQVLLLDGPVISDSTSGSRPRPGDAGRGDRKATSPVRKPSSKT